MKALVLGCGEMGRVAIADLVKHGVFTEVGVATRRPAAATDFLAQFPAYRTRTSLHEIDVLDCDRLVSLMKGYDVVCNTAGPNYRNAVPVVHAAIAAGVSMVDLSDDWEATLEILDLYKEARDAGITVIVGLGASPGVTNVLARHGANRLDRVDEVHTAWVMRGSDPGGRTAPSCSRMARCGRYGPSGMEGKPCVSPCSGTWRFFTSAIPNLSCWRAPCPSCATPMTRRRSSHPS